jgi:hypothetical protein
VVPAPSKDRIVPLGVSQKNKDALPRHEAPLWSAANGLNNRHAVEMLALDAHVDWTTDFLDAAQHNVELPTHRRHSIIGVACPESLGIVTYEDIIEVLLQKSSRDEKDYFNQSTPFLKSLKEGDTSSVISTHSVVRSRKEVPDHIQKSHGSYKRPRENVANLRRRNVTPLEGNDGACDLTDSSFECAVSSVSSYTNNSYGGFHKKTRTDNTIRIPDLLSLTELVSLSNRPQNCFANAQTAASRTISLPVQKFSSEPLFRALGLSPRHSSSSKILSELPRLAAFSRLNFSMYEDPPKRKHHDRLSSSSIAQISEGITGSYGTLDTPSEGKHANFDSPFYASSVGTTCADMLASRCYDHSTKFASNLETHSMENRELTRIKEDRTCAEKLDNGFGSFQSPMPYMVLPQAFQPLPHPDITSEAGKILKNKLILTPLQDDQIINMEGARDRPFHHHKALTCVEKVKV